MFTVTTEFDSSSCLAFLGTLRNGRCIDLIEAGFIFQQVIPLTELYLQASSDPGQVSALIEDGES